MAEKLTDYQRWLIVAMRNGYRLFCFNQSFDEIVLCHTQPEIGKNIQVEIRRPETIFSLLNHELIERKPIYSTSVTPFNSRLPQPVKVDEYFLTKEGREMEFKYYSWSGDLNAKQRHFCPDCNKDCTKEPIDFYMLDDELWEQYGVKSGMICINCMEKRLGRKFKPSDFNSRVRHSPFVFMLIHKIL